MQWCALCLVGCRRICGDETLRRTRLCCYNTGSKLTEAAQAVEERPEQAVAVADAEATSELPPPTDQLHPHNSGVFTVV
jgi:hypothetical protein